MATNIVNGIGYGIMKVPVRKLDRKMLTATKDKYVSLSGPKEKAKARKWVAACTVGNAGVAAATATLGPASVAALSSVEIGMAAYIFNGIYKFKLEDTELKIISAGISGACAGPKAFQFAMSHISWFPGLGTLSNAIIAAGVTGSIGALMIKFAEKMDDARKKGEELSNVIKRMNKVLDDIENGK